MSSLYILNVLSNMIKNIYLYLVEIINMINSIITKLNTKIKTIIPEKYMYIYIITFWLFLLIFGYITENRLIRFCIILVIISIYKIIHKNIDIIYKKLNKKIKQETLLKVYIYKNPLILLLIKIELKMSNIMYNITKNDIKNDIKNVYIKIIYNILYHFTGFEGLKIVLCKFYIILNDWKKYNIYEILFKRIYGMILSVLIFTNIIQLIIIILNKISTSYIVWVYILLVVISYIIQTSSLDTIEYLRKESNVIWLIIIKEKDAKLEILNKQNQYIQTFIGISVADIKYMLNYENYLKYLMLSWASKFNYYKPSYSYCNEIQNIYFETNYIFIRNTKLKKNEKNQEDIDFINYCEYNILIYKLSLYYIWDVEKALKIQETLLKIEKDIIDFVGESFFTYEYNITKFREIYYKEIDNVKLDKFWDVKENAEFYEKMHNYLYDYNFRNTNKCKLLEEMNNYNLEDIDIKEGDEQKNQQLIKELENFKKQWNMEQNFNLEKKYYNIFQDLELIKNKINA